MDYGQSGESDGDRRQGGHAGTRQDGRCRVVERQPVQRLRACRPCLDRRRDSVGPRRSALPKSVRFRPRPAGAGVRPMIRLLAAALALAAAMTVAAQTVAITGRSEEHTSELQSLMRTSYA